MGKHEKTLTIYRLDHPEVEFAEPAGENGIIHNYTEYDENGLPVLDIDYDSNGEIEQKTFNSWDDNRLIESKVIQADDEISEWKTYEYAEDGRLVSEKLHYFDGSVDTIQYEYSDENLIRSKTTVTADDEIESRTIYNYSDGLLTEETTLNEQEEVILHQSHTYHSNGKPSESIIEVFDEGKKSWRKHVYDEDGNRVKTLRYNFKDQLIGINRYFYEAGVLVKIEDEDQFRQHFVEMEYDAGGNVIKQLEKDKDETLISSVYRTFSESGKPLYSRVYMSGQGQRPDQDYLLTYVYEYFD